MVQWLRVETRDREIRVRFPAPAVISDLVVVCHSSQPGPCGTGLKILEVHCVNEAVWDSNLWGDGDFCTDEPSQYNPFITPKPEFVMQYQ